MTTRSKRLAGPVSIADTAGTVTIGTVPADRVWLLKSIRVLFTNGSTGDVQLGIGGVGAGQRFHQVNFVSGVTSVDPDTDPVVMHEGETLQARVHGTGTVATVTVSGAELLE